MSAYAGVAEVLRTALAAAAVGGNIGASAQDVSLHFAVYKKIWSCAITAGVYVGIE